jgi:hypothetical protein
MRTKLIERIAIRFQRFAVQLHILDVKNETRKTNNQLLFERMDISKLPNLDHIDWAAIIEECRDERTDQILNEESDS